MKNANLLNESPLLVLPSLAVAVGLEGSILLQQLHYWATKAEPRDDGRPWVYNTLKQWADEFPFWSERTVRRVLADLRSKGLIDVEEFNAWRGDRTSFYAINYDALEALGVDTPPYVGTRGPCGQIGQTIRPSWPDHAANLATSIKEQRLRTETTTERKAPACSPDSENLILEPEQPKGRKGSRKGNGKITFREFDDALREDEDPVSASVYALARSLGLPHEGPDGVWHGPKSDVDFIELAWRRFSLYYSPRTERSAAMLGAAGQGASKRYADWRAHFRNAVEGCWGNLWAEGREGDVYLTQTGKQLAVAVGLRERAAA